MTGREKLSDAELSKKLGHYQKMSRIWLLLGLFGAEDGTVEAVGHRTRPVFAVQWHPERLCGAFARPESADGARLLRALLR